MYLAIEAIARMLWKSEERVQAVERILVTVRMRPVQFKENGESMKGHCGSSAEFAVM